MVQIKPNSWGSPLIIFLQVSGVVGRAELGSALLYMLSLLAYPSSHSERKSETVCIYIYLLCKNR